MNKSESIKNMVVYQHRRNDTNSIFYIGIGCERKRAFKKSGRNKHWHNIVNKHGYTVEFLYENLTKLEACEIEKQLISKYKRFSDGGILVNSSIGGDIIALGSKRTNEMNARRSEQYTGLGNPMFGKQRPDIKNYMPKHEIKRVKNLSEFNKRTKSKPVIAIDSNGIETIFESQREAARILGLDQSRIWHILKGKAKTTGNYTFKTHEIYGNTIDL